MLIISCSGQSDQSLRTHLLRFKDAVRFVQICSETHQEISVKKLIQNQLHQGAVSQDSLEETINMKAEEEIRMFDSYRPAQYVLIKFEDSPELPVKKL